MKDESSFNNLGNSNKTIMQINNDKNNRPLNLHDSQYYMQPPQHVRGKWIISNRIKNFLVTLLITILAITAAGTGTAAILTYQMQSKMSINALEYVPQSSNGRNSNAETMKPVDVNAGSALNIMLIGQDTRSGDKRNAEIGGNNPDDMSNHQSDTNIIVHISADRSRVDVVSLPRDSIIDQPVCNTGDNILPARNQVMLNSVFPYVMDNTDNNTSVAASCLVNTVNQFTGLDIQQFIIVDFAGLSEMIDAIGGVNVCIPQDLKDDNTGLDVKRGLRHLDGIQATQYARIRKGLNTDGSDIMRTVRQQHLIKSLFDELKKSSTLSNPSKLYNLANAALDNVSISSGLSSVGTLAGLAYSLRGINMSGIIAMTVPTEPYVYDANRVQMAESSSVIWDNLLTDKPVNTPASNDNDDSTSDNDDSNVDNDGNNNPTDSSSKPNGNDNSNTDDGNVNNVSGNDGNSADDRKIDANTGLITESDGRLIDPATGGIVDKNNGSITDTKTGSIIGFADKYVEYTYCRAK